MAIFSVKCEIFDREDGVEVLKITLPDDYLDILETDRNRNKLSIDMKYIRDNIDKPHPVDFTL